MAPAPSLSLAEARRLALAAQGFAAARPMGRVDARHLRRALDDMGVIQIDSVNVLVRSQELPLFARLGAHPRSLIADATGRGELFEYWVHEASHVPTAHHHLHRWRMAQPHRWLRDFATRRKAYIDEVEARVAADGPLAAGDLQARVGPKGTWWDWDDGKAALECLFSSGRIAATRRPSDFARVYDLAERVLPAEVLARPTPTERDARKELLVMAARHHGVGTLDDLADYHRQLATTCRPLLDELVDEGRLLAVSVEGWAKPAYRHPDVRLVRSVDACALLSPFDPVVWHRPRTERLFGFHYRIEIYTPAAKRRFGYYVLPVLVGDRLVGRLDLKADRARRVLSVPGAFVEDGVRPSDIVEPVAAELARMASWLELDSVEVGTNGSLASRLRGAVAHYARQR